MPRLCSCRQPKQPQIHSPVSGLQVRTPQQPELGPIQSSGLGLSASRQRSGGVPVGAGVALVIPVGVYGMTIVGVVLG